jgi:phosphoserine phosphatase
MTTKRIDVLAVMDRDATFAAQRHHMMHAALMFGERQHYEAESLAARAAVAELIEAVTQRAVTAAIAAGLGASEWQAFLTDRERAALARVGGAS